jgi:hypothetical protein
LYAFVLSVAPSLASAADPAVALVRWTRGQVDKDLVQPLAKREAERSRFSRVRLPPRERRVRVLKASVTRDARGLAFVPFAVDVRYGEQWKEDITGCVYKGSGDLYVKRGEQYRAASFLFGKLSDAVVGVCAATPGGNA